MPTAQWMEQASKAPLLQVMAAAGLEQAGRRWLPCPVCGAKRGSSSDSRRGAIKPNGHRTGWWCVACGEKGDGLNLVAHRFFGAPVAKLPKENRHRLRDWFASWGWCKPYVAETSGSSPVTSKRRNGHHHNGDSNPFSVEPENPRVTTATIRFEEDDGDPSTAPGIPRYPPQQEVEALWNACSRISQLALISKLDAAPERFIRERRWDMKVLDEMDIVRITPYYDDYDWPEWWPRGRAGRWRIVVRAFDTQGVHRSLHARAVLPCEKGTPKVLWPKGFDAAGLVMADDAGIALLQDQRRPDSMLICEGLTSFVSVAIRVHGLRKAATLSATNGSFQALRDIQPRLSIWTDVYAATDVDGPGQTYARQVATALAPIQVKRLPIVSPQARAATTNKIENGYAER